jgi:hypothetical protein
METIAERKLENSSVGFWGAEVTRVLKDRDFTWENNVSITNFNVPFSLLKTEFYWI